MDHAAIFDDYRSLLFSIAYRMLGSVMEAEDIVQEAFLRWQRADPEQIDSPKAYLSAVVTRLCIDQLRSARERREMYIGPWLPEPLVTAPEENPASAISLGESLSMAFLVLLEKLSPEERAVFLMREVFDTPYTEIARMLVKTEAACRQLFARARQHITEGRPRYETSREEQEQVTARFLQACMTGDLDGLMSALAPDVISLSDSGGKVSAARRAVHGADNVARFILGLLKKAPPSTEYRYLEINGQPAIVTYIDRQPFNVTILQIGDGHIQAIHNIVNPEKLQRIPPLED